MKTFSQVIPGDFIYSITKDKYFILKKDEYGNVFHDGINFHELAIDNLRFDKEMIMFNRTHHSYQNKWTSDLDIPAEFFFLSVFETKDKYFFTEKDQRDLLMRQMAVNEIKRIEQESEIAKQNSIKKINEIRKNYYSVLNKV